MPSSITTGEGGHRFSLIREILTGNRRGAVSVFRKKYFKKYAAPTFDIFCYGMIKFMLQPIVHHVFGKSSKIHRMFQINVSLYE